MTDTSNQGLGSPHMSDKKKHDIQSTGGQVSSAQQNMSKLGEKGGKAAQRGEAHDLTDEERSRGGKSSSPAEDTDEI